MYNHGNNKGGGQSGMMWMMISFFLLLGILFLGGDKVSSLSSSSGGYFWPILIGVFVVAHLWMMFKGHGRHEGRDDAEDEPNSNTAKQPDEKDEHKPGGC